MARGNFGERLKRERELREVTLEEITAATRIGPRFLEALENEDWNHLPGGVFNRGFVRSVARYLGLDEESLLGEYDLAHGAPVTPVNRQEDRIPSRSKWIPVALALGALFLLAGLVLGGIHAWRYFAARRAVKQSLESSLPSPPRPAETSTASPPVAFVSQPNPADVPSSMVIESPLDLFVSASAATRLRVLADGDLLADTELHAGENRHVADKDLFVVTAADSGALLLELNGQARPPLGTPGAYGTISLGRKDLRQASRGNAQP
jgi:cytoskeleton protein RodZ